MALSLNANKTIYMIVMRTVVLKFNKQFYSKQQEFEVEREDTLDNFTTRLMQNKIYKWENKKTFVEKQYTNKLENLVNNSQEKDSISIKDLNVNEVDQLFQKAIDFDDDVTLTDLTKQCAKYEKCPSLSVLLHALSFFSQNGDRDTIVEVVQLCEKLRPDFLQENSNFQHYLAEAIWIKGNIVKSLEIFEKIYKENSYLRRRIRCILKNLIENVLCNKSEASLINIITFSEHLVKEYNDYYLLGCIWQICFLSSWFSDQQMALQLLEKHKELCKTVVTRIPYVVSVSLVNHQTESIYRLTELLMKYDMKNHLPNVILALLDYFIKSHDRRRCNELIKWAVKNDIDLPVVLLNEKLIKLFINERDVNKFKYRIPKQPISKYRF